MSETSVATSGEAQKAALARRERLLESEGAVYEVLVMEGISQRYSTRTHFESLGRGGAERIFNESVPHSRVCLVTRRAYEGIWPARRAVDTPSWHQVHLVFSYPKSTPTAARSSANLRHRCTFLRRGGTAWRLTRGSCSSTPTSSRASYAAAICCSARRAAGS